MGVPRPLRVVVAGGGIAAAEVLLALRDLAGDRVSLTLVSPSDELILPALSVAEPFALGRAQRYALAELLTCVGGDLVAGSRSIRGTTHSDAGFILVAPTGECTGPTAYGPPATPSPTP